MDCPTLRKKIENLTLMSDRFSSFVFSDKAAVESVLKIATGEKDLVVTESSVQETVLNVQGRDIRLDIKALAKNKAYNIEIQNSDEGASPKRARYNSGLLDQVIFEKGLNWEKLLETYIIFITKNDVLGKNLPIYHIENTILETGEEFNDSMHIIYINCAYNCNGDTDLEHLIHDFNCKKADEMYIKELADRVRYFKETKKGEESMCEIFDQYANERAMEIAKNFLSDGMSVESVAKNTKLPIETVQEIKDSLDKEKTES